MKKLLLTFMCLLGIISAANAADPKVTLDFTSNDGWKLPTTATTDAATYTNDGYTISFGKSSNGHRFNNQYKTLLFGKNDATLTLPVFAFDVEKITVKGITSGASGKVTFNIFVGETKLVTTDAQSSNTDHDFPVPSDLQSQGTIYTIKITNDNNCQISKIEIYEKEGEPLQDNRQETSLSWNAENFTYTIGGTNAAFPTLTTTPADLTGVTYNSSNTNVATIATDGAITIVGDGTTTITASFAGDEENYKPAEDASYILNVVDPYTVTFDFKNNEYGLTRLSGSTTDYIEELTELTSNGVSIIIDNAKFRLWSDGLRFYKPTDSGKEDPAVGDIEIV